MSKFIALISLMVLSVSAQANEIHPYFQLQNAKVEDVTAEYPVMDIQAVTPFADCKDTGANFVPAKGKGSAKNDSNPLNTIEVFVDQIINIGKKIWAIIDAGRPVVNIKLDSANALPRGVNCWLDLENWQAPQSRVYRVTYVNGFGSDVVTFNYRVSFIAGGSLNGVGQYITNAQIMPATVDVGWGFTFNAQAEVPAVFNMGSKAQPIAGLQMNMKWSVDTAFQHMQESEAYHMSGKNKLVQLK